MPHRPAQPAAGTWSAERVRAHIVATYQFLARSRQHAKQAMAQARYIDQLLHGTSQRSDAADQAEATRSEHLVEVMEQELAAHERAVGLHEAAAQLQEEGGWPARAAAARGHATHAREGARRAREELARYQERAASAQERLYERRKRLP